MKCIDSSSQIKIITVTTDFIFKTLLFLKDKANNCKKMGEWFGNK